MRDRTSALVDDIISRAARRGNSVSLARARTTATAALYLWERDLRIPITVEQARALAPEARRQYLALCAGWKEWANAEDKERLESIIEMLVATERQARAPTTGSAPEPICGWSNCQGGGVYTKSQWRQAS